MRSTRRLRAAGSLSPRLDAELLLGKALGRERAEVLAHPEQAVGSRRGGSIRCAGGAASGGGADGLSARRARVLRAVFRTDARALIPRPETELLVELGIAAVARWRARGMEPSVVEVGTGSGAVAVSLAWPNR